MTTHTKGPWVLDQIGNITADENCGYALAMVVGAEMFPADPIAVANGRLMAASPVLLDAAEKFVRLSDAMAHEWSDGDWRAVLKLVRTQTEEFRAAIKLAKDGKP
jgi:hypothetical protein